MKKTLLTDISRSNVILKKIFTLLFLCMLLFFSNSNAQGTTCATAETLFVNGACDSSTITDLTQNTPLVSGCGIGTVRREGWYTFTVTGGPLNITITGNAADRNLALQLISTTSNCAGTLTQIACANATTTNSAQIETITQSLANGTYYLKVLNVGNNNDMILNSICVTAAGLPPANATCATATTLACGTTNLAGTTIGTTGASANGTGCSMSDYGVWYTFVGDGQQTTISSTATFDHEMSISSGSCGTQASISCNDSALSGGTETYTFTTVSATVYYVYVAHYLSGSTTTGAFTISRSCTPAYNPCTTIPNIAACGTTTNLTVASGNGTYGTSACGFTTPGKEYIYTFTAATTGTYTIQQLSSFGYIDYQFKLVSGGCSSTGWTCIDDMTGAQTSPNFSLTAGNQYYFLLDPESTTGGSVSFIITCGSSAPVNSTCASATTLPCGTTNLAGTTVGTSSIVNGTGCSMGNYGVWYTFVGNGYDTTISSTANFDHEMAITSGSCGSLVNISCNDVGLSGGTETATFSTILGTTYYVYISHYSNGSTTTGTFTISRSCTTCSEPTLNAATSITLTTATISWNPPPIPPSNGYQYFVSTSSATPVGPGIATGATSVNLTGLVANTTYYVFVRSDCGVNGLSIWTPYMTFTTGYCPSTSTSSTYYINNFSTAGGSNNIANNASGYSAGGYGSFIAQTVSQINFGSVTFSAAFYDGFYTYGFNIWVDWNNDFDFNDASELVYASGIYVPNATGTITVPGFASVGNHRMRIVANYLSTNPSPCGSISSGETEDYTFTVLPPLPCADNPTSISVTVNSQTTATIHWIEPSPAPANGYQYYLSTSNSTPGFSAVPTGSVGAGSTSVALSGLISGTTYYVWVRANCGGGLGQGVWIGPISFAMPNCALGSGSGTTTLSCPGVDAGGLGLLGVDLSPINPCATSACADLEAIYPPIYQSTSYNVQSIPYSPPYQFNCLRNPVSINVDDVWSTTVNLPFQFCFFGTNHTQCIIGSNGVISFDLTNNTPGGYNAWSFASNLPNTSLFRDTIFGVYHDIDPSIGGEVGWELITLNNGCRALVAAWDDIPMFSSSCNSMLYTGMIVLYENTNVIEVYVQEKNVCSTWNSGNAIIGIQNATGTQAVVPPNRNGLDPDWTVPGGEAWRFVPSGAPVTNVTWFEGSGTGGPVVGTGNTVTVCPTATTTYTARVTYSICSGRSIVRTDETTVTVVGNKVWNGSVSSNWNVAGNWTPAGVPTAADCVIIPNVTNDPVVSGTGFNGLGKNLSILTGGFLTINGTNSLTITDFVNVNATGRFLINDDASLVQTNNVANVGNIEYERNTNIRLIDYVYWSSPVNNFPASSVSPLSPTGLIWKWNPTHNGTDYGIWVNGNENMALGRGYIIRGPSTYTSTPANYTATFIGVPNNGNISTQIIRGTRTSSYASPGGTATAEDDNWNLLGNPYPSALDAISFVTANTNIDGSIRLWTHGQPISTSYVDPFYGDYVYNYSVNDYISYNSLGSSPPGFLGKIGTGQSFFVQMNHSSPTPSAVVFNNAMRSSNYSNSQFYRNSTTTDDDPEKSRIWLNIVNTTNNQTSTTLVGYANGATYEKDRLFDAFYKPSNIMEIYSFIEDKPMIINGRPMPFDQNDMIPIGITTPLAGSYTIGILDADGLFQNTNQMIYLKDNYLETIHDLRQSPYTFTSQSGNCGNRFILRYTDGTLNNSNYEFSNSSITAVSNNFIEVLSTKELLDQIVVYDILGRKLAEYKKVNSNSFTIKNLLKNNTTLLLDITTENGNKVTKKIIY